MNVKSVFTAFLLSLPLLANAGAREELMALEATKTASSADAAAITASTIPVPVLKYLTNAQSMGMSATYLLQVSDFIAQDLMIQYLQELVKQASLSLAGKNFPEEAAAKLRDNIIHAQGLLADMKLQSAADQNALDGIDRNMQYLQQQVTGLIMQRSR